MLIIVYIFGEAVISRVDNIEPEWFSDFAQFIEDSKKEFSEFMNRGNVYTSTTARVFFGDKDTPIPTDSADGFTLNVVNYCNPSYREATPTLNGSMRSVSQTYGLFYMATLSGMQNVPLYEFYSNFEVLKFQLNVMTSSPNDKKLVEHETEEVFFKSHIIGYAYNQDMLYMAVRHDCYQYSRYNYKGMERGGLVSSMIDYPSARAGDALDKS